MKYCIVTDVDFPQLAQMRWDFRTEDDDEAPVVDYTEFIESCIAYLRHSAETGTWTYWVAKDDNEIISHIFVHTIQSVPKPCSLVDLWGYVTNVYTTPAYRNKGIGSELMRHVKQWAQAHELQLLIVSPSDASIAFYERAGFSRETEWMELTFNEE